jgi:Rrf2 family iron-sulfur cluster assembly transcriptional regulator
VHVGDVAAALSTPRNYLSKILHVLARDGVLASMRGPGGGFRLAVEPGRLRLARVVGLFDPPPDRRRCVLGRPRCSDANPCGAHELWKDVANRVTTFFHETTIGDVLASAQVAGVPAAGEPLSAVKPRRRAPRRPATGHAT